MNGQHWTDEELARAEAWRKAMARAHRRRNLKQFLLAVLLGLLMCLGMLAVMKGWI